ncbi:MAG: OmpA family protein [Bacteroidota bacterium]
MRIPLLLLLLGCALMTEAQNNFRVQITAFETPVPVAYFTELDDVWTTPDHNELNHYYLGDFATRKEAETAAKMARDKGYPHAHVLDLAARREACKCTNPSNDYIRHLFFDFDEADLRLVSKTDLSKLAKVMRDHPDYRLKLIGHTDNKGSDDYNDKLSARRANNAKNYLNDLGVALDRISIEYMGEVAPIAVNQHINGKDSPQGRQLNRRVVVQITDTQGQPITDMVEEIRVPRGLKML